MDILGHIAKPDFALRVNLADQYNMKAILLCGGKGERLRPLTTSLPKPLVPIKGKAILSYVIDHLKSYGLNSFVIASGYKAELIDEFFEKNYSDSDIQIVNSKDADILQRIIDCMEHVEEDFMVLYGDTLSNVDIDKIINFHKENEAKATVTLWPLRSDFGVMDVENNLVSSYVEKPILDKWINIGYFCLKKELLPMMKEYTTFKDFLNALVEKQMLHAWKHKGVHITVNTQKELSEAEKNINLVTKHEDG